MLEQHLENILDSLKKMSMNNVEYTGFNQAVLPFKKYVTNPIIKKSNLLAENIVFDKETNLYWMVHSNYNYNDRSIGLAYSSDLCKWQLYNSNPILMKSNSGWDDFMVSAPHLFFDTKSDAYDLYYAGLNQKDTGNYVALGVAISPKVIGPYLKYECNPILVPRDTWETKGVNEPFVFWDERIASYVLFYMGNSTNWPEPTEQIGYAMSLSPLGLWSRYSQNPVLRFDATTYDKECLADPSIYIQDGVYYIFYACGTTKHKPWRTAYATSKDLIHFVKKGIALDYGPKGSWDHITAFRGAVQKFGDYLYFSYTGWPYRLGMAKMPAASLK